MTDLSEFGSDQRYVLHLYEKDNRDLIHAQKMQLESATRQITDSIGNSTQALNTQSQFDANRIIKSQSDSAATIAGSIDALHAMQEAQLSAINSSIKDTTASINDLHASFNWKMDNLISRTEMLHEGLEAILEEVKKAEFDREIRRYKEMGNDFVQRDLFDEALDVFQKALALNPVDFSLQHGIGRIYLNQARFQDALPYFTQAARYAKAYNAHENEAISQLHEARCHYLLAEDQPARELAQAAVTTFPALSQAHYDLNKYRILCGEKALEGLQEAVRMRPAFLVDAIKDLVFQSLDKDLKALIQGYETSTSVLFQQALDKTQAFSSEADEKLQALQLSANQLDPSTTPLQGLNTRLLTLQTSLASLVPNRLNVVNRLNKIESLEAQIVLLGDDLDAAKGEFIHLMESKHQAILAEHDKRVERIETDEWNVSFEVREEKDAMNQGLTPDMQAIAKKDKLLVNAGAWLVILVASFFAGAYTSYLLSDISEWLGHAVGAITFVLSLLALKTVIGILAPQTYVENARLKGRLSLHSAKSQRLLEDARMAAVQAQNEEARHHQNRLAEHEHTMNHIKQTHSEFIALHHQILADLRQAQSEYCKN